MDKVTVLVGSVEALNNGSTQDLTHEVQFEGEELGSFTQYGYNDRSGGLTDARGTDETLYRTADGRLVVHVKHWSRWQGEPTTYRLYEVTEADLAPTGRFAQLGAEAGYGRPLSLDEALEPDLEWEDVAA